MWNGCKRRGMRIGWWKTSKKRRLGRPRRRWKNNIEMDLTET